MVYLIFGEPLAITTASPFDGPPGDSQRRGARSGVIGEHVDVGDLVRRIDVVVNRMGRLARQCGPGHETDERNGSEKPGQLFHADTNTGWEWVTGEALATGIVTENQVSPRTRR